MVLIAHRWSLETLSQISGTECLVSILVTSGRGLSGQYLDSLVDGLPSTINQYIYIIIYILCHINNSNGPISSHLNTSIRSVTKTITSLPIPY